jgi:hypothetical protein
MTASHAAKDQSKNYGAEKVGEISSVNNWTVQELTDLAVVALHDFRLG